jgi:DNA-binding NtrC family response regulator
MRKANVLFVDDEELVLRSIERIVMREPYSGSYVSSADEALKLLKSASVDVVVSDMKMPVMDGLTFLKRVKVEHPDIVRIVLSGFSQVSQVLAAVNNGEVFRFLTKPLDEPDEFRHVIRAAIEHSRVEKLTRDLGAALKEVARQLPPVVDFISQINEVLRVRQDDESERKRLLDQLDQKCSELRKLLETLESLEAPDDRK